MLHAPTLFTILSGSIRRRRQKPRTRPRATLHTLGKVAGWKALPMSAYKKRTKLRPKQKGVHTEDPECCCFRYCDSLYQLKTPAERLVWRKALKKGKLSPYDLFMSECLTATIHRLRPPDVPSISGGWSTRKVIPGTTHPLAPCWGTPAANSRLTSVTVTAVVTGLRPQWRVDIEYNPTIPLPPGDADYIQLNTWFVGPPDSWLDIHIWHYTHFPVYATRTENYPGFITAHWPPAPYRLITAPADSSMPWTYEAPNYVPWGNYPVPPDPWPNQ